MTSTNSPADSSVRACKGEDRSATKVYLVGGGIASMAAAVFLIRDGDISGHNITIFEELDKLGGSLRLMIGSKRRLQADAQQTMASN